MSNYNSSDSRAICNYENSDFYARKMTQTMMEIISPTRKSIFNNRVENDKLNLHNASYRSDDQLKDGRPTKKTRLH